MGYLVVFSGRTVCPAEFNNQGRQPVAAALEMGKM
jgi:hypothetical protein